MAHPSSPQAEQPTEAIEPISSVHPAWILLPALAITALILGEVCPWLRTGTLPPIGLFIFASSLLFASTAISGFFARVLSKKLSLSSSRAAVQAAFLTALWIPAWILFIQTWSWLMMLAATLCLATLSASLKRQATPSPPKQLQFQPHPAHPFQFETAPLGRALLPSLAVAVLAEAAIALTAAHRYPAASAVSGLCTAIIAWRSTPPRPLFRPRFGVTTMGAFLLTLIALLPYLKVSPLHVRFASLLPAKPTLSATTASKDSSDTSSDGYSGIILLSPSEQRRKITLPVKHEFTLSTTRLLEPREIPFDGTYWYFRAPDRAPRPNARVVRLSSLKANIHSSDWKPLLMEAHQKLGDPIDLGCCSAIQIAVTSQDHREGTIALELWVKLRSQTPPAPHYLGTMTIPSSLHPTAELPAEEKLLFPIPSAMDGTRFDEIIVVVRSAPARSRSGAQIAIRRFSLEP
jgi:hypothetical protein